ncbi:MAG: DUF6503 family protein [Bacteroidota bacterium]
MRTRIILSLSVFLLLFSCARQIDTQQSGELLTAQTIIDKAIDAHGGSSYDDLHVQFVFRKFEYELQRQGGKFQYERRFEKEGETYRDVLSNDGFVRHINGKIATVVDSMADKYANSVNSVHYFAQLPYGLNDPAVHKKYLGTVDIKEQSYHKIEVSFQEEGGGKDYDDVFVYWIQQDNFLVDYLAYSYRVDGGGLRFREAFHPQQIDGVRFQDYVNYKADPAVWSVHELDEAFMDGKLKELSKIELELMQEL